MYDMRSHSNHVSCLIALYYCQHIYKYQIKNNDKNYILFNITNKSNYVAQKIVGYKKNDKKMIK